MTEAIIAVEEQPLKVVLLGCGTVGSQVARLITEQGEELTARIGRPIELVGIAVRNPSLPRPGLDPALFTSDAQGLVARGDIDIVIELIGGLRPANELVLSAIDHGASIVTANKALLAECGAEIFPAAERAGVDLYYEAAVAGAIPIVRPLRESLVGDEIRAVMGIVNGTTNYILDKMTTEGLDFATALAQAQQLGYAEADPTADVEGFDAAAKASILASLAFHTRVRGSEVYREGMSQITPADIEAASSMGCVIKMLAVAEEITEGRISVRVHPTMVPAEHPLAMISGANNAIFVEAREAGRLMFMGPGAGGAPTASAVVGDLVTVARNRTRGISGPGQPVYRERRVAPMADTRTRYYLRFNVADRPGVLAAAATIFAQNGVSVQAVQQSAPRDSRDSEGWSASLGMLTHVALESDVQACVAALRASDFVKGARVLLTRVEG